MRCSSLLGRVRRARAPSLAFRQLAASARPIAVPTARPSSRVASVESAALVTPARATSHDEIPTNIVRPTGESPSTGKEEGPLKRRRVEFETASPNSNSSGRLSPTGSGEGAIAAPPIGTKQTVGMVGVRDQQSETPAAVLAQSEIPAVVGDQQHVAVENQTSGVAVVISDMPSSSAASRASSSAAERGKGVVVDDYESESDLDPDDVRMFEEGLTHSVVNAGGLARILRIPFGVNLLAEGEDLVPQFSLLCSEAENESLRSVPDAELIDEVAVMVLRTYMVEVENIHRANIRARIFLKMLEK
ncbi:uncharacterized protein LOC107825072 [Nicotiana tabacum]|uniref:Uncharacterized protein LOC107825072 n=1 Tax=Nicotiana tabacum TaxID=4097 RepID=A0A1S4D292_TOBAC|nr:PREDICTED: uncharacterized protein LOC107825072 [Nicotiana tabacum]